MTDPNYEAGRDILKQVSKELKYLRKIDRPINYLMVGKCIEDLLCAINCFAKAEERERNK